MDYKDALIAKIEGMLNDERRTSGDRHWLEVAQRRIKDNSFSWVDPHALRVGLRRAGRRDPENASVMDEAWEAIREDPPVDSE